MLFKSTILIGDQVDNGVTKSPNSHFFGKLRKKLPQYEDNEIKSALRYAKTNAIQSAKSVGTRMNSRLVISSYLIVKPKSKKTYEVIKIWMN